ncbi:hypothetical protein F4779DRAFT_356456 [Xylariaceae sp. FL0662B]|nr:hypothetical protein F4779DRAFT_356456 [Xylariaceae sp. FL0662B]
MKDRSNGRETAALGLADINTRAYVNIKETWGKRGIWYTGWDTLSGMSWKHELLVEKIRDDDRIPPPASLRDKGHGGEVSPQYDGKHSTISLAARLILGHTKETGDHPAIRQHSAGSKTIRLAQADRGPSVVEAALSSVRSPKVSKASQRGHPNATSAPGATEEVPSRDELSLPAAEL